MNKKTKSNKPRIPDFRTMTEEQTLDWLASKIRENVDNRESGCVSGREFHQIDRFLWAIANALHVSDDLQKHLSELDREAKEAN